MVTLSESWAKAKLACDSTEPLTAARPSICKRFLRSISKVMTIPLVHPSMHATGLRRLLNASLQSCQELRFSVPLLRSSP
ncbi:Uncharacterised protein [Mycobacterium tuberculosis]|nr:Uncharacterised protein [Mycobacterium tuberculosis]